MSLAGSSRKTLEEWVINTWKGDSWDIKWDPQTITTKVTTVTRHCNNNDTFVRLYEMDRWVF